MKLYSYILIVIGCVCSLSVRAWNNAQSLYSSTYSNVSVWTGTQTVDESDLLSVGQMQSTSAMLDDEDWDLPNPWDDPDFPEEDPEEEEWDLPDTWANPYEDETPIGDIWILPVFLLLYVLWRRCRSME